MTTPYHQVVMSSQRHIRKRSSLKPTAIPATNPLKTRGFGKGIQARNAELPNTNLLQTRSITSPHQGLPQKQDTRSVEEQLEGAEKLGYNAADIPVHAPETPQPPVQRQEGTFGGWNQPPTQRVNPVTNRLNMWREEQLAQAKTGKSEVSEQEAGEGEQGIERSHRNDQPLSDTTDNPVMGTEQGLIQPKCEACEAKEKQETLTVQAKLAVEQPGGNKENKIQEIGKKEFLHRKSDLLQRRSPDEETETENNETRAWNIPFGGGRAETYEEALEGLEHIHSFIFFNSSRDMPEVWEEKLDSVRDSCWDAADKLRGKFGLLDPDDTNILEIVSSYANTYWNRAVEDTRNQVVPSLKKLISGYGLDNKIADLQEKLHFGFIEGADEEHIKAIQETLSSVKEYKEKVDKVIGWAKDAAGKLKKAKALDFFKKMDDVSGKFGSIVGYAEQATEAAKIIYNLATDKGASGNFVAINTFEAGLDGIDLGMGFVKSVPIFGQLWSEYYSPVTRECLRLLREIAKLVDKRNRDFALFEWMRDGKKARMGDGSPKIPDGLQSNFPGRQSVLSYMWNVCNRGRGIATSSVKSYFVDHADQFNAGISDRGVKLRTESTSTWYDPTSWGDERTLNLDAFVSANKDMIWAMLYGSMKQNI